LRILLRHLLPAARGFLAVQATLLVPVFILAEATLSFAGLGFAEPTPSWGVMLHEASRAPILAEAPWLLTPAVAIILTVLALNLASGPSMAAAIETVIPDK
jgi:peptide/nickel transport system permease protein